MLKISCLYLTSTGNYNKLVVRRRCIWAAMQEKQSTTQVQNESDFTAKNIFILKTHCEAQRATLNTA